MLIFSKTLLLQKSTPITYNTFNMVLNPSVGTTCTLTYDGVDHTATFAVVPTGTLVTYTITNSTYGTRTGIITVDSNKVLYATGKEASSGQEVQWEQPILTSNGTLGGDSCAVASSSGSYPYYAFDGNAQHYYQSGNATYAPHYIIVYNPDALKLSSVQFKLYSQNASNAQKDMSIYGSDTNGNWTLLYSDDVNYATAGTDTATYLVNATSNYKYLKFQTSGTNQGSWVVRKIYLTATYQATTPTYYWEISDTPSGEIPWVQPVLTENGTIGGDTMAVASSRQSYDSNTDVWKAFDGNTSSSSRWYPAGTGSSGIPIILTIYTPEAIKISNLQFTNYIYGSNAPNAFTVYGSSDNETYTQLGSFTNTVQTANAVWDVDLSNNTNFYQYYKIEFTQWNGYPTGGRGITEIEITATQRAEVPWVQPIVTEASGGNNSITTPEGTVYSCNWTRGASYAMSYAFDGIIPTTYSPQCACFVRHTGQSNWVEVYNPNPIKVSQIIIYWSSGSNYTITETINIEASNDGVNYVTLVNGATHDASATISPHTIPVNNNNFYNYYKITNTTDNRGYWYVGEIEITATVQS